MPEKCVTDYLGKQVVNKQLQTSIQKRWVSTGDAQKTSDEQDSPPEIPECNIERKSYISCNICKKLINHRRQTEGCSGVTSKFCVTRLMVTAIL